MPPIPEWWAAAAMALPGKAYHVGSIVWQECRMNRSASCRLTQRVWEKFSIHRHTVSGGLRLLAEAGLIILEKSGKRSPLITIVNDESKVSRVAAKRNKLEQARDTNLVALSFEAVGQRDLAEEELGALVK
jgi:hypothetical protein